jgi:hypothetical protein
VYRFFFLHDIFYFNGPPHLTKVVSSFCIQDAAGEIAAELQGTPDFIIGNYSDGNLVASLLSYKMGITQVCPVDHT